MDWDRVIEKNRAALKRVIAALAAMAGIAGSTSPLVGFEAGLRGAQSCRAGGTTTGGEGRDAAGGSGDPAGWRAEGFGEGYFSGSHTLPRHLHRAVLRLLRPAESAVRRLVIVAARDIVLPPLGASRPRKPKPKPVASVLRSLGIAVVLPHNVPHPELVEGQPRRAACGKIALPLFDPIRVPRPGRPRTVPAHAAPRILSFDGARPYRLPPPPSPDDPIDAARLNLRLAALASALDDLAGHARRFARWRARRDAAGTQTKNNAAGAQNLAPSLPSTGRVPREARRVGYTRRLTPLRPGRPPGLSAADRRRPAHEVHEILAEMQYFAVDAMKQPDTS